MKQALLVTVVCLSLSTSAFGKKVPVGPPEVRRQAFEAKAKCIQAVTSEPDFKTGTCGSSGCMNAYSSCESNAEAVVSKHAQDSVALASDLHSSCMEPLQVLLAIASNDLPSSSELDVSEPLDTAQSVSTVRRLAAYELIYMTVKDKSCYPNAPSRIQKR